MSLPMKKYLSIITLFAFLLMIYINYLSGIGQINNISAGGVSGKYPTLFTPAGFTFSIWGLIYLFGLIFIFRLIWMTFKDESHLEGLTLSGYYIISCFFNISWIYSWHYEKMGLSVVLMIGLLLTLVFLYQKITENTYPSIWKYLSTLTPVSLYLGWICIATVANISLWLTSIGWDGSPFTESFWASLMIIIAALLNLIVLIRKRDIFFALVFLWAAYGIIIARSKDPFDESVWVSSAAIMGMIIVFLGILYARFIWIKRIKSS